MLVGVDAVTSVGLAVGVVMVPQAELLLCRLKWIGGVVEKFA